MLGMITTVRGVAGSPNTSRKVARKLILQSFRAGKFFRRETYGASVTQALVPGTATHRASHITLSKLKGLLRQDQAKPSCPFLALQEKAKIMESVPDREQVQSLLAELGAPRSEVAEGTLEVRSPISGEVVGRVKPSSAADVVARWRQRMQPSCSGGIRRRRSGASWCGCSARSCAPIRRRSAGSSPSRAAKSSPKGSAKCRR